jgi:hypothetical protein
MPQNMQPRIVQQVAIPQHYTPPTARELRAQAVHRLQVGLFGLAAMLLMVGLANIVMDRARQATDEDVAIVAEQPASRQAGKGATDPLADIGIVPAADPSAQAVTKAKQ